MNSPGGTDENGPVVGVAGIRENRQQASKSTQEAEQEGTAPQHVYSRSAVNSEGGLVVDHDQEAPKCSLLDCSALPLCAPRLQQVC